MLSDASYTYTKLLHDLSRIVWYLDKHAKHDVKKAGHVLSDPMLEEMRKDLESNIEKVRKAIEGLSREGKF